MLRGRAFVLVLAGLFLLGGCRDTEDYLNDLGSVYDREEKKLRPEVYDAGQLVHEALGGLTDQDTMTLSQMARSVAYAGYIVGIEKDTVPLCQSQSALLLAHMAERYPIPPVDEPFEYTNSKETNQLAGQQVDRLAKLLDRLTIETTLIPALANADRAVVERALEQLRVATGEDLGRDPKAWEEWWKVHGPETKAAAARDATEPFQILSKCQFANLGSARAVLLFFGLQAVLFDAPELRDLQRTTILRLSRQVVVLGISEALRRGSPEVRGAGALAAARVNDPAFADALAFGLARERDAIARSRIIGAMAQYPRRDVILLIINQLSDDEPIVKESAQRALVAMTSEDFGADAPAWELWWDKTGKRRWP